MKNSLGYFVALLLIVSLGCNAVPSFGSTPTPERLYLINDELEACLLISTEEVESTSGIQVTSEQGYEPTTEKIMLSPTVCRYVLKGGEDVIMLTSASTDATLTRQGFNSSASEWFQQMKMIAINRASEIPAIKLQDISGLGEQAYREIGTRIDINVLKNDIVYWFSTDTIEDGGMGYDALFNLAIIALERAP